MYLYPYMMTDNTAKAYYTNHKSLYYSFCKIHDIEYRNYLKQQNKKLYKYLLFYKINHDTIKHKATSLETYTASIYSQISYATYINYYQTFTRSMNDHLEQLLLQHHASADDISTCFYIRNIYNLYKGARAEYLLQKKLSETHLAVTLDTKLDKYYGVDLLLSSSAETTIALQLKSIASISYSRFHDTEERLKEYTSTTDTPHFYILYNANNFTYIYNNISNSFLFSFAETQNLNNTFTSEKSISTLVSYLVSIFT